MRYQTAAVAVIVALVMGVGLTACGDNGSDADSTASGTPSATATGAESSPAAGRTLTEQEGKLVDTDVEAKVFDGSGLKITIDPAKKTARFQLVDPGSGKDFSDYYVFDYSNQTMVNHKSVAAMGAVYDYTLDLGSNEVTSIKDANGAEVSDQVRKMGRFDQAQTDRVNERKALESHFQQQYGKTIQEATQS